ncbi:hypothetical protein WMY93_025701 [Mugilogobius chulae]|uniref:G-protein coupled receptors family 1 profile domain-containing protein n=1 Tax=Mugilogobius chulae TaxID=88201 RepID=A0AAW0MZN6_9GOBI
MSLPFPVDGALWPGYMQSLFTQEKSNVKFNPAVGYLVVCDSGENELSTESYYQIAQQPPEIQENPDNQDIALYANVKKRSKRREQGAKGDAEPHQPAPYLDEQRRIVGENRQTIIGRKTNVDMPNDVSRRLTVMTESTGVHRPMLFDTPNIFLKRRSKMAVVLIEVILSVYIISFLMGLPANLLAMYAFSLKIHNRPLPTDILLLNLTVSDLLFLCILPLKMHEAASGMIWTLPDVLCSITSFIFFCTIYTSSLLLMAVSVVRYIAVAFPVTYQKLHKPLYAIVCSAVLWFISAAHCSITFITQHHPALSKNNSTTCYEDFTDKQLQILLPVRLEFFVVLCLIPLLICVFCYLRCIYLLYTRPRISPQQKQKAIGMAVGTLAVFLVCMLPYNLTHLLGYFEGQSLVWRYYTLLLSTFNTCLDPIIFYFSSSAFRGRLKKSIFFRKSELSVSVQRQRTSSLS